MDNWNTSLPEWRTVMVDPRKGTQGKPIVVCVPAKATGQSPEAPLTRSSELFRNKHKPGDSMGAVLKHFPAHCSRLVQALQVPLVVMLDPWKPSPWRVALASPPS